MHNRFQPNANSNVKNLLIKKIAISIYLCLGTTISGASGAEGNLLRLLDAQTVASRGASISPWQKFGDPAVASAVASLDELPPGASTKMILTNSFALAGILQFVRANAFRGKVLTLQGLLKVSGNDEHSVGLWIRTDDEKGNTLTIDNMADSRLTGVTPWTKAKISLYIPEEAYWIRAGVLIRGSGSVEIANLDLRHVDQSSPPAADEGTLITSPNVAEFVTLVKRWSLRYGPAMQDEIDTTIRRSQYRESSDSREFRTLAKIVLQEIGDHHSFFQVNSPADTTTISGVRSPGPEVRAVSDEVVIADIPSAGTVDAQGSLEYALTLQKSLFKYNAECGLIVDLRANVGGNMWPMLTAISPILPSGTIGWFVDRDGVFTPWTNNNGDILLGDDLMLSTSPSKAWVRPKRIAVLVSSNTASSGEATAIALKSVPNVRYFGEPTAGLTTANRPFTLMDGSTLLLETSRFADYTGTPINGPIVPDQRMDPSDAPRAAEEWINSTCR